MTLPYLDLSDPNFSTKGPEVRLAREQHWCAKTPFGYAILRHKEAGRLLRDRRLRQGSYAWPNRMGLKGSFAEFWSRSIISQEGAFHRQLREVLVPALSDRFVSSLVPGFREDIQAVVDAVGDPLNCEFMSEISVPFAGRAICRLLGLHHKDWQFVSSNASDLGLAMGLDCKSHQDRFNAACDNLTDLAADLVKRSRSGWKEGFVPRLVNRFDAQTALDEQALLDLIVISIFGGVDTTRGQLAFLMALFADAPDQWVLLHEDPDLAGAAIEEAIRLWPTTTWATRETLEDFSFEGVDFTKGTTVHVFVHSAATDPSIHIGDGLNLTAKRKIHFGFGGGAHHCVGHFMARTDMAVALKLLSKSFSSVERIGNAAFLPDSGNTSPVSLPLRLTPLPKK